MRRRICRASRCGNPRLGLVGFLLVAGCQAPPPATGDRAAPPPPSAAPAPEASPILALGHFGGCWSAPDSAVACWDHGVAPGLWSDAIATPVLAPHRVRQLDIAGNTHCATRMDGGLLCWGHNGWGQLGAARATMASTEPVSVVDLQDVRSVAVGADHVCALRRDGRVSCWGRNDQGQTAQDEVVLEAARRLVVPRDVGLAGVVDVAAGDTSSCAIGEAGDVHCWGRLDREVGRRAGLADPRLPTRPRIIAALGPARSIDMNGQYGCVVREGGTVTCFGSNLAGRLGEPQPDQGRSAILDVPGIIGARDVATGPLHACALHEGGGVSCWGSDAWGQLGRGGPADGRSRSATAAPVPDLPPATHLAVGGALTCARSGDGQVSCWGKPAGAGTEARSRPTPVR